MLENSSRRSHFPRKTGADFAGKCSSTPRFEVPALPAARAALPWPLRDHPLPTALRSATYGRINTNTAWNHNSRVVSSRRVDDSGVGLLARLNRRDAVRQTKAAPFRCLSGGGSVITFVKSSSRCGPLAEHDLPKTSNHFSRSCSSWMSLSARKIARASAIRAWSAMRSRFRKRSRPLDFSHRASARPGIRRLWGLTSLVRNMRPASGQNRPPVIGNLCFRDASAQFTIKVDQAGKRHQRGMKLVPDTHVVIEFCRISHRGNHWRRPTYWDCRVSPRVDRAGRYSAGNQQLLQTADGSVDRVRWPRPAGTQ